MHIITSGQNFLDIDAYAGIIAYAELLNKQNIDAQATSTAPLNATVSPIIRSWGTFVSDGYIPDLHDQFTLVDVSDPAFFDRIVKHSQINEIIDHHMDFKTMWEAKLGDKAQIECVGAACTLVCERWEAAGMLDEIHPVTAGLLMSGMLDNTLNFGAVITTDRDRSAYARLAEKASLPDDWPAMYFTDCQQVILDNIRMALAEDTKTIAYPLLTEPVRAGQLALWDAREVLADQLPFIREAMQETGQWYVNIISLRDGCSYFLCDNRQLQQWLAETLGVSFEADIAIAGRMWLRKEIMKQATDGSTS